MHADSPQKCIWIRACAPMQTVLQLLCRGSYCELILSLARTSCSLSFTIRPSTARGRARPPPPTHPPAALLQPVVDAARFKNPSKSTLAHDAVAAAVLHKHHLIIRVGAGLIQVVYGSRSHLANGGYPSQKCVFAIFARVRVCVCRCVCVCVCVC